MATHEKLPCIPYGGVKHTGRLQLMLLITQSIKNKEDLLTDYVINEAAETWLTNHVRDAIWMELNGFVKDGYQISAINRVGKKGGGLALIYRSNITVTKMEQKQC